LNKCGKNCYNNEASIIQVKKASLIEEAHLLIQIGSNRSHTEIQMEMEIDNEVPLPAQEKRRKLKE